MLPADVAGYGFDNNADALTLSSALTERYLGAAAKISQMALARPRGVPAAGDLPGADRPRPGGPRQRRPAVRVAWRPGGAPLLPGRRRVPVRDAAEGEAASAGGFEGITDEPHQLEVSLDNVKVWTGNVGGPEFVR